MSKLVAERTCTEKNGIMVFDDTLDQNFSSYDSSHLNEIAHVESEHFWFRNRRDKICAIFDQYVEKDARILEVGAGTGFIAQKIQEKGYSIEVSDCYSNGLAFAKRRGIKRLYQFDLFNPPFRELFDVICLFDVLEHLKEASKALFCLKQMLKPRGKIILTAPAHMFLWSRDDVIAGHEIRYNKEGLENLFLSCGFTPIHARYFFMLITPLLYLRKWMRPDFNTPIQSDEKFHFQVPRILNRSLHWLTKFEFLIEKWVLNCFGGSLIAVAKKGSPQHVMLGLCDAQAGDMQGAAFSGNPKQATPQRVGDAGRRSQITHLREQSSALHVKDYPKKGE